MTTQNVGPLSLPVFFFFSITFGCTHIVGVVSSKAIYFIYMFVVVYFTGGIWLHLGVFTLFVPCNAKQIGKTGFSLRKKTCLVCYDFINYSC